MLDARRVIGSQIGYGGDGSEWRTTGLRSRRHNDGGMMSVCVVHCMSLSAKERRDGQFSLIKYQSSKMLTSAVHRVGFGRWHRRCWGRRAVSGADDGSCVSVGHVLDSKINSRIEHDVQILVKGGQNGPDAMIHRIVYLPAFVSRLAPISGPRHACEHVSSLNPCRR